MELENIMVSEISQTQTNTTCSHLYVDAKAIDPIEVENSGYQSMRSMGKEGDGERMIKRYRGAVG
jgi:hypothetical protein